MTLRDQGKGSRLSLFAKHAAKYYAVGGSGVLVNLGLLFFLTEFVGLWYFLSYALAISASITTNFILNKMWTFRDSIDSQKTIVMYGKFVGVSGREEKAKVNLSKIVASGTCKAFRTV